MIEHSVFSSQAAELSPLDVCARQIMEFMFRDRRYLARFKSVHLPDTSLTVWKDGVRCVLVVVSRESLKADHLVGLLSSLEETVFSGNGSSHWTMNLSIDIFASQFDPAFLSKLRFLTFAVSTYEWMLSQSGERDMVFIKEVPSSISASSFAKGRAVKSEAPRPAPVSDGKESAISDDELSALMRLNADLRKIRQAPSGS